VIDMAGSIGHAALACRLAQQPYTVDSGAAFGHSEWSAPVLPHRSPFPWST
jgi:hypothetical protein